MKLEVSKNRAKIVQISDVHISYPIIEASKIAISKVIEAEQPDLVVFSGDLFHRPHHRQEGLKLVIEFIQFIDSFKTKYTLCFGNHDSEINISKYEMFELFTAQSKYFIGEIGDLELTRFHLNDDHYKEPRIGNFYIDVENNGQLITRVTMLDSGRYNKSGGYGSLTSTQTAYVQLSNPTNVPNLIFFHIALPEFEELYKDYRVSGLKRENVCYQTENCELFEWALTQDNPIHISCGHDHLNDFSIVKENVSLNMCPGLCYEEYNENGIRGYLVFTVDNEVIIKINRI
ncbi:metallophosphoesterase [Mollicutes bacterium LVI A0039]|nr:metallophosphoesterase [Mollicutes bacterium LVI A0039]